LVASSFELINFMEQIAQALGLANSRPNWRNSRRCWPCLTEDMICWPVSPRVGNVKNNDPSLIGPVISGFLVMTVAA
jgi:hypothetical protein